MKGKLTTKSGVIIEVDGEVGYYIFRLQNEISKLRSENLELRLKSLKKSYLIPSLKDVISLVNISKRV